MSNNAVRSLGNGDVPKSLLSFAKKFPIRVIYDCGSRDATEGLVLLRELAADELHVFECNPTAINLCRRNVENSDLRSKVFINATAIADRSGEMDFFPIDPVKTQTPHADGNIGASSLFHANPDYPAEKYVQDKIRVPVTTLDSYYDKGHRPPDLIWMDLQGAELMALQGATDVLRQAKMIFIEVSFKPLYLQQPLFWEIHEFLSECGWILKTLKDFPMIFVPPKWINRFRRCPWQVNAVYTNSRIGA